MPVRQRGTRLYYSLCTEHHGIGECAAVPAEVYEYMLFAYMIDTKFGELTLGQGQLNHRMHVARCALLGPTRTPQVRTQG